MKRNIIANGDIFIGSDTDYVSRFDDSVWGRNSEEWVGDIIYDSEYDGV